MVTGNVGGTVCWYAESDVSGAAATSVICGIMSGDQGLNTIVRKMDIAMNRLEQYEWKCCGWKCVWRQAASDVLNRVWVERGQERGGWNYEMGCGRSKI